MPFCNTGPSPCKVINGVVMSLQFKTRALLCFNEIYFMFHANGVKGVPGFMDLLLYLTPEAIAHWVIGDGTWTGTSVTFCTDSFTVAECIRLIGFLHYQYGWHATINMVNGRPRIRLRARSMVDFRRVVGPYILPSFQYKLGTKK
jgi:hypothetical protein